MKPRNLIHIAIFFHIFLAACATKQLNTDSSATGDAPVIAQNYQKAVTLAQNPTPAKISDQLVAILSGNSNLIWKTIQGQEYVLMATWTGSFKYYQPSLGQKYNTGNYEIWVTAAPGVQELCSDPTWAGGNLELRLEQLLGLPPNNGKIGFASFWVRPQDLFRPCPDNEITDTSCDLSLPADVSDDYRTWFNDLRAQQYVFCPPSKQGYPWTQLGYTFDWHDLNNPVGMSEFIIRKNADVYVEALTPTNQYCAQP